MCNHCRLDLPANHGADSPYYGNVVMNRISLTFALVPLSLVVACRGVDPGDTNSSRGMRATGVSIQIPLGDDSELVASGEHMNVDGTGSLTIRGDASVRVSGDNGMTATANRIEIEPQGPKVDMEGNVKARFSIPVDLMSPQGGEDANQ